MLSFSLADSTGKVEVKCSGQTLGEVIKVDDCIWVSNRTVHRAWQGEGVELHYEDGQGVKRRRYAVTRPVRT